MKDPTGTPDRTVEFRRVVAEEEVAWEEGLDDLAVLLMSAAGAADAWEDEFDWTQRSQVADGHRLLARLGLHAEPCEGGLVGHAVLTDLAARAGSQPTAINANCDGTKM